MIRIQNSWGTEDLLTVEGEEKQFRLVKVFRHQVKKWLDLGIQHKNLNGKTDSERMVIDVIKEAAYMDNQARSKYKILLDVDGWGWSARYRELLRTSR